MSALECWRCRIELGMQYHIWWRFPQDPTLLEGDTSSDHNTHGRRSQVHARKLPATIDTPVVGYLQKDNYPVLGECGTQPDPNVLEEHHNPI
ncbi:Hypothetical predicted protein [Pelobates cultripes]|uniref:Uncharacterized protein n=1 Tax=Pelobates cultripes TaxID=61616 RepID=A0AAD1QZ53_PELCU|nr:Hypothetical predicted protein [Pelobates cultripes]CAH2219820.1 Hypothetical predicted protein [Pelobates cultripes]